MKFEQDTVNQIVTVVTDGIEYYLPHHMVEHWTYVYEFNSILVRFLDFIEVDFRVWHHPLNPCTKLCYYPNQHDMYEQNRSKEPIIKEQESE